MILIQRRDQEILKFCYEQQFITIGHVAEGFYNGKYFEAARRVRELLHAKYLKQELSILPTKQKFYRLTLLGRHTAESYSSNFIPQKRFLAQSTLIHDSFVSDVRIRLSQLWDGTWIPESAAKKYELMEFPDGIILFPSGKKVAIEVENSVKGIKRFQSRLRAWDGANLAMVFYVATTRQLEETLKRYLKGAPSSPHFGLTSLDALKNSTPSIWSPHGAIQAFTRRSL